jgi:hypothetical protein
MWLPLYAQCNWCGWGKAASKAPSFYGVVAVVKGGAVVKLVQAGRSIVLVYVSRSVGVAQRNTVLQWVHNVSHTSHVWSTHAAAVVRWYVV